jgi:hypothetical protein
MKKLSVLLASMVLFAGVSFASPQQAQPTTEKKETVKPAPKGEKKAMTNNHKKAEKKSTSAAPAAK